MSMAGWAAARLDTVGNRSAGCMASKPISSGLSRTATMSACVGPACATASYELDWFGTLRGRAGYLVDPPSLLYVTGGFAYGHLTANFSGPAPSISDSATRGGWVVGGGFERALHRNWTLRAEYLYMDLGTMRTVLASTSQPAAATFNQPTATVRTDFTDQIFRVGVSYRFGEAYAPLK